MVVVVREQVFYYVAQASLELGSLASASQILGLQLVLRHPPAPFFLDRVCVALDGLDLISRGEPACGMKGVCQCNCSKRKKKPQNLNVYKEKLKSKTMQVKP